MLGALHEVACGGAAIEHGAAAMLLSAGILARLPGQVLWVLERPDLFAPALDAVGLPPDRVIYAEAGKAQTVLLSMEEGLRHAGLAGVVGELSGKLTLTVLSAVVPASNCHRLEGEVFEAASNTLKTAAVRRRKWNLR